MTDPDRPATNRPALTRLAPALVLLLAAAALPACRSDEPAAEVPRVATDPHLQPAEDLLAEYPGLRAELMRLLGSQGEEPNPAEVAGLLSDAIEARVEDEEARQRVAQALFDLVAAGELGADESSEPAEGR